MEVQGHLTLFMLLDPYRWKTFEKMIVSYHRGDRRYQFWKLEEFYPLAVGISITRKNGFLTP